MFFSKPIVELPKITAPTAAEICVQSKPSPEGQALLTPEMTPPEYLQALEKNKLAVDSVHLLAHGLPGKDAICWACQGTRLVAPKLSMPELDALKLTEAWLKVPSLDLRTSIEASLGKVDFTGPASWAAQAALWFKAPGAPALPGMPAIPAINLTAAAVVGAILLAAGLVIGVAMPAVPKPKLALPTLPPPPEFLLQLKKPQIALEAAIPTVTQPKLMKLLLPFIDLGKGVALGTIKCC